MKKNIEITIKRENRNGDYYSTHVITDLDKENNVKDLIEKLKPHVSDMLERKEIVKEQLLFGTEKMNENQTVPAENGIELVITIK